ncbi:MAG: AzlD domain-containing protein [Clostridia bacterium]|nr:AzlD domain-containing protein [Clostridia bacterium]
MQRNVYIYIFVMFAVTYLIRVLPLTLIRKPIRNRFIRSFLYYVPYVTLAVMTFPDIVQATNAPVAGFLALIAGVALAWSGKSLLTVAVVSCAVVFITEMIVL